jgi:predicted small lipoprotein YifL
MDMKIWTTTLLAAMLIGTLTACQDNAPQEPDDDKVDAFELEVDGDKVKVKAEEDADDDDG